MPNVSFQDLLCGVPAPSTDLTPILFGVVLGHCLLHFADVLRRTGLLLRLWKAVAPAGTEALEQCLEATLERSVSAPVAAVVIAGTTSARA